MKPVNDSKPIKELQTSPDLPHPADPHPLQDTAKADSVRVLQAVGGILSLIILIWLVLQLVL
jgi:hypothetical protein